MTAAELALAGIGASAFVGVVGITTSARVARRTSQEQRLTALAQQLWMRRADVYVELLHVLADWAADRHRTRTEMVTNPTTPPRTPTTRDWSLLQAKTDAFASPLVADLFGATIDADKGFVAVFSATYFPDAKIILDRARADGGGNVYHWADKGMEGWFCPALLK